MKHPIQLDSKLSDSRESYPFSHVFLHKVQNSENLDEIGADILTTLYIDANLAIRGVEVKLLDVSDIISKDDSKNIIVNLMEELATLQDEVTQLREENKALKAKLGE